MATLTAFNDMMEQFINELVQTFPDQKQFQKFQISIELLRKTNPRKILDRYMRGAQPLSDRIMARDETVIQDVQIKELNLAEIWTPELSVNTKNAIWQYLQTLLILGTTISSLPQDALNAIEAVAKQCAENMDLSQLGALMGNFPAPK